MLLSTSSFNCLSRRQCLLLIAAALLVSACCIGGYEYYLRKQGYIPLIIDSPMLWSIQRDRAKRADALVFAGASRTQFGIHLPTVRQRLPHLEPVVLAVNGRYPLATLRHLARDERFNGTLLLDIDARGFHPANWESQADYGAYYDNQWSPNWHVHRALLTHWQSQFAMGRPAHSVVALLQRALDSQRPPYKPYTSIKANRIGVIHFDRVTGSRLADKFAKGLAENLREDPPPPADQWADITQTVRGWVRAIESRGGKVMIYEPPVQNRQKQLLDEHYPRSEYWDLLCEGRIVQCLSFRDIPAMAEFDLPDESHIDTPDRPEYTVSLLRALISKGFLEPPEAKNSGSGSANPP